PLGRAQCYRALSRFVSTAAASADEDPLDNSPALGLEKTKKPLSSTPYLIRVTRRSRTGQAGLSPSAVMMGVAPGQPVNIIASSPSPTIPGLTASLRVRRLSTTRNAMRRQTPDNFE